VSGANAARGEAALILEGIALVVRPSFAALVAAEAELGSLLALVERAGEGRLALSEMAGLVWHCLAMRPDGWTRERLGEALLAAGVAQAMPAVRMILRQLVAGAS